MRKDACKHFIGIQHAKCAAGVEMKSVECNEPGFTRIPCVPSFMVRLQRAPTSSCAQYQEPTAEEIAAFEKLLDDRLAKMRDNAAKGLCDACEQKITAVRQDGRCVYAVPCGHRVGQGVASEVAARLKVPVTR